MKGEKERDEGGRISSTRKDNRGINIAPHRSF